MTEPDFDVTDLLAALQADGTELPSAPVRVLGIDLGTTNSTVAEIVWRPGEKPSARCLEVEQPTETGIHIHTLVPSVVACCGDQVWVGEGAKRLRTDPRFRRNRDIFYECKNEMGVRRTYHQAPEGFRSAAEIGARVLAFLRTAAESRGEAPARTVVTVPASFQLAQRNDTLRAASLAGLRLEDGDLLEEPVAVFLDYLFSHHELMAVLDRPQVLVVFDFGGGTCDVVVFRLQRAADGRLETETLAVSRYHRLGGGDIDAAIVHEVLIPQLVEQNGLDPDDLEYGQRKRHLEPVLLNVAEALKVGLCMELARMRNLGRGDEPIVKTHPGRYRCPCPGYPDLVLDSPSLTSAQFEAVLEPFLDTDFLYARETEYYLTCSVFAPLQDTLERAGLENGDVTLCLMVGGGSLIPQVQAAVREYFPAAQVLAHRDLSTAQLAVARGAAYHALIMTLFGRSLIRPVASDRIALRTASGLLELVPRGAGLPHPEAGRHAEHRELVVPKTSLTDPVPLRVEVVAGEEARPVFAARWEIPAPVERGEPLRLRVRLDANHCLHLELALDERPEESFACTIENPIMQTVNPDIRRERIMEVEEALRNDEVEPDEEPETVRWLATQYVELGQVEKAIDYLKYALKCLGRPHPEYLNLLGIWYGQKQDWKRQEKAYREAARTDPGWAAPLFNLALSQYQRGLLDEAEDTIRQALAIEQDPPYRVLLGEILAERGQPDQAIEVLDAALAQFAAPEELDDWALGWLRTTAATLQDQAVLEAVKAEQKRRRQRADKPVELQGWLPEVSPMPRNG